MPSVRARHPYNPLYMNPQDMADEGLTEGDAATLSSEHGSISALVKCDPDLRPGVVQISHGFGGLPDAIDYESQGVNTNLLLSLERRESINAMPRMSGVPVALTKGHR